MKNSFISFSIPCPCVLQISLERSRRLVLPLENRVVICVAILKHKNPGRTLSLVRLLSLYGRKLYIVSQLECRIGVTIQWLEVNDKIILDSKYRVIKQILASLIEDLGCQGRIPVIAGLRKD